MLIFSPLHTVILRPGISAQSVNPLAPAAEYVLALGLCLKIRAILVPNAT